MPPGILCPRQAPLAGASRAPPRAMELVAGNLSEGNASGPEPPTPELPPLFGIGVENFLTLVVFGLIFALGVLGNSLVITVLARSKPGKPRSTTNLFILNLSIADLAYLLFCIPFQATVYALPTWVLGAFICKFIHYFFTVSMLVSIFTLAAMSVDRYVAIVHSRRSSSLRVSRNALLGVGCIWALSIAMASPVAYHQRLFHRDVSNQTFCWEEWPNQRHKKAYVVCTFVFGYVLPLLLICFCYAKVGAGRAGGRAGGGPGGPWHPRVSPRPFRSPAAAPPLAIAALRKVSSATCGRLGFGLRVSCCRESYLEFGGRWESFAGPFADVPPLLPLLATAAAAEVVLAGGRRGEAHSVLAAPPSACCVTAESQGGWVTRSARPFARMAVPHRLLPSTQLGLEGVTPLRSPSRRSHRRLCEATAPGDRASVLFHTQV